MEEIWKDISGFEGYYQISNLGNLRSIDRFVTRSGKKMHIKGRIMRPYNNGGYHQYLLRKDGKSFGAWAHREVAKAFIPNPDNLPCVNHKDENPSNNRVDNLEWCTYGYNLAYNDLAKRKAIDKRKPILQYSKDGEFIREWSHAREAAETLGLNKRAIYECCAGRSKTSGGYIWKRK